VIRPSMPVIKGDEAANDVDDVVQGQDTVCQWDGENEFPVELVTADFAEIIATSVEEKVVNEGACIVEGDRITRAQFPIDVEEGFVFGFHGVSVQSCLDVTSAGIAINYGEGIENTLVA